MTTIYVVTAGCYSDYNIVAMFSTRERAVAFMEALPEGYSGYNDIEEYELDNDVIDKIAAGYSAWLVQMLVDGTVERIASKAINADSWPLAPPSIWKRTEAPAFRNNRKPDVLSGYVLATSRDHAVKIVNELRLQMIASGEFK